MQVVAFRVSGFGSRVQGLGFRFQGSCFEFRISITVFNIASGASKDAARHRSNVPRLSKIPRRLLVLDRPGLVTALVQNVPGSVKGLPRRNPALISIRRVVLVAGVGWGGRGGRGLTRLGSSGLRGRSVDLGGGDTNRVLRLGWSTLAWKTVLRRKAG